MLCRIFFYAILALLLCHCSAPSLDGRGLSHGDAQAGQRTASLAAFDEHMRPALSICASCHGKAQAPLFLVEDTATAHDAALGNVDFDNISNSNFLKRIIEQKHNCGDCDATGKKVKAALTKWKEARASAGSNDEIGNKTPQLSMPKNAQAMQWDIGKFISDEYSGGRIMLSVRVEPDNDNKMYSLVNLKVYTDKIDVYVRSIKPLINGKWNSKNAAYNDIDCAVKSTAQRPNGHIIHATSTSIPPDDFSADNKISFAVAEVRLAAAKDSSCWSDDIHKDVFTNTVKPIITENCVKSGCHNTEARDENTGGNVSSYQAVMDQDNAIKAILTDQNASHTGRIQTMNGEDKQQILDWLNE